MRGPAPRSADDQQSPHHGATRAPLAITERVRGTGSQARTRNAHVYTPACGDMLVALFLGVLAAARVRALPLPHDDPESSSVRCLNSFAWDLERHGHQRMNFSAFEHFPLADGSYVGRGGRALPPKGRAHTFAAAFRLFERSGGTVVAELGTTRSFLGEGLGGTNDGVNAGCFDGGCTPEEVCAARARGAGGGGGVVCVYTSAPGAMCECVGGGSCGMTKRWR